MSRVYKNEPPLFVISLLLSLILWLALIGFTFGIALIYLLLFFILYLFAHSAFISHLRGTAVLITPEQFPDLYWRIAKCCDKLPLRPQPDAYLLHGNGVFNALATRFLGRNFIVLYSDVVDALAKNPEAVNFYIGHELGHIHRNHLVWGPLLWPSGLLPLIGAAYSRAREYTCDLYGLICCEDPEVAASGLAALAAGHDRWQTINMDQYSAQIGQTGGFWMSFHELISDYPWLIKRVARVRRQGAPAAAPGRNIFAWLFAMFIPRLGIGGGPAPVFMSVAIIGIMAAVAIPAYQDYTVRAKLAEAVLFGERASRVVGEYINKNNAIPSNLEDAGIAAAAGSKTIRDATIDRKSAVIRIVIGVGPIDGKSLLFIPSRNHNREIIWRCASEDIPLRYLPAMCRPPAR